MGFLDHSTNNIIIDAVLTNIGREQLASNAGVFLINKFSLSDDEVDYSLITKFGRTVGKEKIIKNTPVFEAQTGSDIAQKFRMQSIQDPTVTHLPVLQIQSATNNTGTSVSSVISSGVVTSFALIVGMKNSAKLFVKQTMIAPGQNPPDGLNNMAYDVYVNNQFIEAAVSTDNATGGFGQYNSLDPLSSIARYAMPAVSNSLNVVVRAKDMSPAFFEQYKDPGTSGVITTTMSIVGRNSGARADCTITISQS
jgi:hypothetical protein